MKRVNDILDHLCNKGLRLTYVPSGSYYDVEHSLTSEQFHEVVMETCKKFNLQPQDPNWMPGSPTGDVSDVGYYVYPVNTDEWDELSGTFDMCIADDAIYWC